MAKKKFKNTLVGQILFGLAKSVPILGPIISGAETIEDVLKGVTDSNLEPDQKVDLQKAIFEAQATEERELTKRVEIDSHHAFTRNIRPGLALWYTALFAVTLLLDAFPQIPFDLSPSALAALAAINGTIIAFWFGGRTLEKIKGI